MHRPCHGLSCHSRGRCFQLCVLWLVRSGNQHPGVWAECDHPQHLMNMVLCCSSSQPRPALNQACSLLLALRPSTLVWNAASQLTEDSTYSDFSTELRSAKICSLSDHSLSSLQNSADSQILLSSCCSVQAGPFVFQVETYEWLKTTGKNRCMPYSLPSTL